MLTLGLTGRIWICVEPQDGRKSFDGLQAVVRDHLARNPLSGDLFVFRNRRGDRLRILAWQGDGFALYLRRLEQGTFAFPAADTAEVSITATELAMILGGIELGLAQRRPQGWVGSNPVRASTAASIEESITVTSARRASCPPSCCRP